MKRLSKVLSLALACVMILSCTATAFAAESEPTAFAEETEPTAVVVEESVTEIPVVFEGSATVSPRQKGDYITFRLGTVGNISDCGNNPKFKCWVTGGNANTQVKFEFETSGGVHWGPFGPLQADGSNYLNKSFAVLNGGGSWKIIAYVSSGEMTGNEVCHVEQYY